MQVLISFNFCQGCIVRALKYKQQFLFPPHHLLDRDGQRRDFAESPHVQAAVLVSTSPSARQRWAGKGLCGVTGVAGRAGFDPTATDLFPVTSCLACCFQSGWSAACCRYLTSLWTVLLKIH